MLNDTDTGGSQSNSKLKRNNIKKHVIQFGLLTINDGIRADYGRCKFTGDIFFN